MTVMSSLHSSGARLGVATRTLVPFLMLALSACQGQTPAEPDTPGLKDAFSGSFVVGAALNTQQFTGKDSVSVALVAAQFNTITPENVLKWERVHPAPDSFAFEDPDAYVAFGEAHDMFIVGHTLVWHQQTPKWVFEHPDGTPLTRDELLARLQSHISTVVGRYKGRIDGWDVVNEALNDDGTMRDTPWKRIIGDDYIAKAFEFARAADPAAQLYYNDYSLANPAKRRGAIALVESLRAAGVTVDGIGEQGHYNMGWPSAAQFDSTVVELGALGIPVHITELDIDVLPTIWGRPTADLDATAEARAALNPYVSGLPDSVQAAFSARYRDLFDVLVRHADMVERVTFWGVHDGASWLNGWPVPGRTNYPLLFDRAGAPKPAYDAVMAFAPAPTPAN